MDGTRFKSVMESRGVTVEQAAAACGHQPATVARWLDGEGKGFSVAELLSVRDAYFPDLKIADFIEEIAPAKTY